MLKISEPFGSDKPSANQYQTKDGYNTTCLAPPKNYMYEIRYIKDYYDKGDNQQWYRGEILMNDIECDGYIVEVNNIHGNEFDYKIHVRNASYLYLCDVTLNNIRLAIKECERNLLKLNKYEETE
tara:strand:+ start:327 stop:701 length:375 start_codon:yes stop_codon:yes gene_type:complete